MSQDTCLDCYKKHIATACVFEDEAAIGVGYPLHKWLAIGELNAAEKEVVKNYPMLAQITREHRIAYQVDNTPVPTLMLIELAEQLTESLENTENETDETLNNVEE